MRAVAERDAEAHAYLHDPAQHNLEVCPVEGCFRDRWNEKPSQLEVSPPAWVRAGWPPSRCDRLNRYPRQPHYFRKEAGVLVQVCIHGAHDYVPAKTSQKVGKQARAGHDHGPEGQAGEAEEGSPGERDDDHDCADERCEGRLALGEGVMATRRLTPIERLQKSAMSVDKLRAEMSSEAWEQTLADAKAGDDVAMLKIEAATTLYNAGHPCWSPEQKKVVFAHEEKARAEKWARRVAVERIRKFAPMITVRAESAEPITKREGATERHMSKRFAVSFVNIVKGEGPDQTEWEFTPDGLAKVTPEMDLGRPKPTDATRPPQYPADSFLAPNPDEALTPVIPGGGADVTGAGTMMRDLNLLTPTEDDQTGDRAMFSPSRPGRNPADGPKSIRLGDARVPLFKKRDEGLFTDLLLGKK